MNIAVQFDKSDSPPLAGSILSEIIFHRLGMPQADFARAIGISRPRLNMILKNKLPVSAEIAVRLERVTGINPQYWMVLRADFDLHVARQKLHDELEALPVSRRPIAAPQLQQIAA